MFQVAWRGIGCLRKVLRSAEVPELGRRSASCQDSGKIEAACSHVCVSSSRAWSAIEARRVLHKRQNTRTWFVASKHLLSCTIHQLTASKEMLRWRTMHGESVEEAKGGDGRRCRCQAELRRFGLGPAGYVSDNPPNAIDLNLTSFHIISSGFARVI
ncbi:hypothetical protein BDV96DRAFT_217807 [Lophiotrema nucula]|uniref:Uncharacterized protein n=1 Tax=Lophiotrema nucula TaxID=690887 RepID=A0A6A5ZQX8_9PLEO|nr:hypothetical protein BDV96DRAFT_217807 [Lophiotrema nucula]